MLNAADRASAAPDAFSAALLRLDLRLRLQVETFRGVLTERAQDPFRGLYVSEAHVEELLAATPTAELARQLLAGEVGPFPPRLERVAELFGLDSFEAEALLVCLAPDVDLRYERLYGYLQDDVTRKRPTVDLVLRVLGDSAARRVSAREALSPGGTLLTEGLLSSGDDATVGTPFLARPLRVDERLVEYLLGSEKPDARIRSFCQLFDPSDGTHTWILDDPRRSELVPLLVNEPPSRPGRLVYLQGPPSAAKLATLRGMCEIAGRPLLLVDSGALLSAAGSGSLLAAAAREALLQDAVLGINHVDLLLGDDADTSATRNHLHGVLRRRAGPTVLLGEARWEPALWLPDGHPVRVPLAPLRPSERLRLWHSHLNGTLPAAEVATLASRYRLDDDAIRAVASAARGSASSRGAPAVDTEDVRAAARAIAAPPLEGLARRLEPRYAWDDIVLPPDGVAQLRELCGRALHQALVLGQWGYGDKHARRAGITALFAGPPGTGKTMAAEIVAGELGLALYRIDLSATVSKYIGETEKNLERIFRAADQGDAVLLFDEADALFGKRSEVRDAHDRYANVEVAYLLQRLEAYDGVAILTTNLRGNIDEAFVRRLDCVLEFPLPEEAERLAIWRLALPSRAPLADDVDLPFLARKFKLAGGHIRNIALTAAFLAAGQDGPVGMKHLARATRREYQKLGKLVAESDFEHYYPLLRDC